MSQLETRLIEVRDRMTFIPVLAVRLANDGTETTYLLRRAGFIDESGSGVPIILTHLSRMITHSEAYEWGGATRTMFTAHAELVQNWDKYPNGSVLDVRVVQGETDEPATSERFE